MEQAQGSSSASTTTAPSSVVEDALIYGKCKECKELHRQVDAILYQVFKVSVCISCKSSLSQNKRSYTTTASSAAADIEQEDPDAEDLYGYLSQRQAKLYYSLSPLDLKSLPFYSKKNPHNSKFAPVKLFLRSQLQLKSRTKYPDGLEKVRKQKRERAYKRAASRTANVLKKQRKSKSVTPTVKESTAHVHSFPKEVYHSDKDVWSKTCSECKIKIEYEKL